jgi:hypothetical protein
MEADFQAMNWVITIYCTSMTDRQQGSRQVG